jgi:NADPH:quinone reductase-like Zn-dependent oxidoreductase
MMKRIDLIKTGGFAAGTHLIAADVPLPTPSDNQVIIQVKASAIQPVDWKMATYGFLLPETLPAALGCDVAGIVVKSTAQSDWVGKRVVANVGCEKTNHATSRGAYVEQVAIDADVVIEIPERMTFADAATLPVGAMTATAMLDGFATLPKEEYVLVWGASSSVGFNTVQMVIKRGWKPIAVASGKHEATMKALGVEAFVDYTKDNVKAKIQEILGDSKLNAACDCIGTPDTFGTCGTLVKELGDATEKVVSTVNGGTPEPPDGVKKVSVFLGAALDDPNQRKNIVQATLPIMTTLETQQVRSVSGPFVAETLEKAFQASKDGVSGEKVVIEWTK